MTEPAGSSPSSAAPEQQPLSGKSRGMSPEDLQRVQALLARQT